MLLDPIFEKFVHDSPLSVMARGCLQYALVPECLDALFEKTATRQYTRELLFSTVVELMALVVCGMHRSVHAAYQAKKERVGVSITALYDKLDQLEPDVSTALIPFSAQRLGPLVESMQATLEPELAGVRLKILDGNHLAATQHRLKVLRDTRAAPLPGQALVVLDPQRMQAVDVVLCEDGHAQERALTEQILARVQPGDLWLADRNFSTAPILFGIAKKDSFFLIRQHGQSPSWLPLSAPHRVKRIDTGVVFEQMVALQDPQGPTMQVRRITVELDKPTRDGDSRLHLLTNLPRKQVGAQKVAQLYRKRWTVEGMFQELGQAFQSEINTLCYPKAALFAFCVGLFSYNILSVLKAALRARFGRAEEKEVSSYYLSDEISGTYRGMMIAIPAPHWTVFEALRPSELGQLLTHLAGSVKLSAFRRHPRGPKKPRPKRPHLSAAQAKAHVSTARLLAAAAAQRAP